MVVNICNKGSSVIYGKEPNHKGHKGHKVLKGGKASINGCFSFVTLVSFVVENGFPVKNGRTIIYYLDHIIVTGKYFLKNCSRWRPHRLERRLEHNL